MATRKGLSWSAVRASPGIYSLLNDDKYGNDALVRVKDGKVYWTSLREGYEDYLNLGLWPAMTFYAVAGISPKDRKLLLT